MNAHAKRMKWWIDARFGMFIHWGLYSAGGMDCWMMHDMGIPSNEYVRRLSPRFTAKCYDPDQWMQTAKSAGCKYVIMTSRHHDGYCLWDTDTDPLNSARLTPRRDLIGEFVKAARKAKLRVGLYYSLLDWRYPAYFAGPRNDRKGWQALVEQAHAQVRELMTRYGRIDILWYDGVWQDVAGRWGFVPTDKQLADAWRSRELNRMVRRLQPNIIINDRSAVPEDYGTPEQAVDWIEQSLRGKPMRPWELCDTMGDLWAYAPTDRNKKTARELVFRLLNCISRDGNYLLNIGPKPDGGIAPWQVRMMRQVGQWVHAHRETIYGCGGEWRRPFTTGLAPWRPTRKGNNIYLHMMRYPGTRPCSISRMHDYRLKSARLLDTNTPLKIVRDETCDHIVGLPARSPDPIAPVIKLTIQQ